MRRTLLVLLTAYCHASHTALNSPQWSKATPLPPNMLSSRPQATVLGNGALLLTAGRPGVDLWISTDGFGKDWQRYSLPSIHNRLVARDAKPTSWGYCDAFLPVAANHTFAGNPTPRVDHLRDGGPMHGWSQTSGYNAVVALEDDVGLVCYDKQGWGGGYYGVGLPPIFGPQGAWPKGRAQPAYPGCYLDVSYTFCMRVTVPV